MNNSKANWLILENLFGHIVYYGQRETKSTYKSI